MICLILGNKIFYTIFNNSDVLLTLCVILHSILNTHVILPGCQQLVLNSLKNKFVALYSVILQIKELQFHFFRTFFKFLILTGRTPTYVKSHIYAQKIKFLKIMCISVGLTVSTIIFSLKRMLTERKTLFIYSQILFRVSKNVEIHQTMGV